VIACGDIGGLEEAGLSAHAAIRVVAHDAVLPAVNKADEVCQDNLPTNRRCGWGGCGGTAC